MEKPVTRTDTPEDPIRAAEVERAIAPYRAMFPADVVLEMAAMLDHVLATHPVGAELLDRVRPRATREQSGTQAKDGAAPATETPRTKKVGSK